jgi:hypothetical protein
LLVSQTAATSALRDFAEDTNNPVEELNALDRLLDDGTSAAALPSVHSFIRSGQKSAETPLGSSTAIQPPVRPSPAATTKDISSVRSSKGPAKPMSMVERREKAAARARVRPVNPGTGAEFSRTREAGGVGSTTRPAHGLSAQHLSALGTSSAFDPARAPNAQARAQNASALNARGDFGSDAGDDGFGDQFHRGSGSDRAAPARAGPRRGSLGLTARERRATALASTNATMRQLVAAKKGRVLGARCTLNYKGLGVMYPGRIARVHGDGTYDVDLNAPATLSSGGIAVAFSDDLETRVPGEWVFPDYVEVIRPSYCLLDDTGFRR